MSTNSLLVGDGDLSWTCQWTCLRQMRQGCRWRQRLEMHAVMSGIVCTRRTSQEC